MKTATPIVFEKSQNGSQGRWSVIQNKNYLQPQREKERERRHKARQQSTGVKEKKKFRKRKRKVTTTRRTSKAKSGVEK